VIGYFDDIIRVTVSRPRALDTPESKHKMNHGIETSSIPRFGGCAGAQCGLDTAILLAFERALVA